TAASQAANVGSIPITRSISPDEEIAVLLGCDEGLMRQLLAVMLTVVGVVHLLPLSGVLGRFRLNSLYGVSIEDPDLEIMMRHRAVLFGMLGTFLIYAAFRPNLHLVALIAGFVSVLSFLLLAWQVGGYSNAIARIVTADIVALLCLSVGAFSYWKDRLALGAG
ncbi:MAG: hypothetical protein ACO213_12125, partial [Steroidobacteraceae bacterium]